MSDKIQYDFDVDVARREMELFGFIVIGATYPQPIGIVLEGFTPEGEQVIATIVAKSNCQEFMQHADALSIKRPEFNSSHYFYRAIAE